MVRQVVAEPFDPAQFAPFGVALCPAPDQPPSTSTEHFQVWMDLARLQVRDRETATWCFLELRPHTFTVTSLERHIFTPETFVSLSGTSVVVTAPPSDPHDPVARPASSRLRAFRLEPGIGLSFPPGYWHWLLALSDSAAFLILGDTHVFDDIDIKPMEGEVELIVSG